MKNLINLFKSTWQYLATALIITLILRWKFGAEFFDLFGLIIFGGLILVGLYGLYKKKLNDWIFFALLIVGLFGIIIDGWTSFELLKSWILK